MICVTVGRPPPSGNSRLRWISNSLLHAWFRKSSNKDDNLENCFPVGNSMHLRAIFHSQNLHEIKCSLTWFEQYINQCATALRKWGRLVLRYKDILGRSVGGCAQVKYSFKEATIFSLKASFTSFYYILSSFTIDEIRNFRNFWTYFWKKCNYRFWTNLWKKCKLWSYFWNKKKKLNQVF